MNYSLLKKMVIGIIAFFAIIGTLSSQTSNSSPYCSPTGQYWGQGFDMPISYIYLGGLELINNLIIEDGTIVGINYDFKGYQFENQWGSIGIQKNVGYTIEIWGGFAEGLFPSYYGNSYKVYIDLDQDGEFDTDEAIYTDNPDGGYYNTFGTLTIPTTAKAGITRMRVMADYYGMYSTMQPCNGTQGYSVSYGEIRDFQLNIAKYVDASIVEITQPSNPLALGTHDVWVELANYGTVNLTSCSIEWAVDDETQSLHSWTGNLAPGETELVNVGSYTFEAKTPLGSYAIDAEVIVANGIDEDDDLTNDAADTYYVNPSISPGTYIVGGTSGFHFATLQEAIIYLNSSGVQGVGPVNFQVRSGTYNGQMQISGINNNEINIYPEAGATVNVTGTITDAENNYLLRISNSSNINISNINFTVTEASGMGGTIIALENGTDDISITGCTFNGIVNATRSWDYALIYSFANQSSDIIITGNKFNYGSTGILLHDFQQSGSNGNNNINTSSNQFNNFTIAAVQIANSDNVIISNNTMAVTNAISTKPGMAIETYNSSIIENNIISGLSGTGDSYAITTIHDNSENDALIRNNSITGCTNVGGILVDGVPTGEIYKNNISLINSGNYENISGIYVGASGTEEMFMIAENTVSVEACTGIEVVMSDAEVYHNEVRVEGTTENPDLALVRMYDYSSGIIALNHLSGGSLNGLNLDEFYGDIYYNSINVSTTGIFAAFKAINYSGNAMRNQFVNSGAGMSFNISDLGSLALLDENNYYSANGAFGSFDGQALANLNDLRIKTGGDENSANIDPKFEASDDLHLTAFNEAIFSFEKLDVAWSENARQRYERYSWDGRDRDEMGVYYYGIDNIKPEVTIVNHTKELIVCDGAVEEILGVVAYADFGAEPTFQWQYDGKDILGAKSPFLYLRNMTFEMSGVYRCKVSAPGVPDALYTKPIAVYVLTEPEITKQPNLNNVSSVGAYLKLEVDAHYRGIDKAVYEGNKLMQYDFQWWKFDASLNRARALVDGDVIAGSRTSVLTFNSLRESDATAAGEYYFVVIEGLCDTVHSGKINVSTNAGIAITTQPTNADVCEGESTTFMVEATGQNGVETLTYQWYLNDVEIEDNEFFAGSSTNELMLIDANSAHNGTYKCKIHGEPGNSDVWTNDVNFTLNSAPMLTKYPESEYAVEIGSTLTVDVDASGSDPITYRWYNDFGTVLEGVDEKVLTIEDITPEDAGQYSLELSNACGSVDETLLFFVSIKDGGISSVVERKNGLALYQPNPNPISGIATIQFESNEYAQAEITLYNAHGAEVATLFNGFAAQGLNSIDYNFSNLTSGVYYYTLRIGENSLQQRLVVKK